jgi:predicted dehydrogenase
MRAVIVGAGLMGRWHAAAIRRAGGRVVAVIDSDAAAGARLAAQTGATASTDLRGALARGADVVHVCTPLASHLELAAIGLEAGCHIVLEKPAARTYAETVLLTDMGSQRKRMVVPVHQFCFQDGVLAIRRGLERLGRVRHVAFATCSKGAEATGANPDAIAADILPHPLALGRLLLDTEMGSVPWRLRRPAAGEWRFDGISPGGATIAGLISLASRPPFASLEVLGDRGSVRADLFHGFAVFETGRSTRAYKVLRPFSVGGRTLLTAAVNMSRRVVRREPAYPGLFRLIRAAYAAVREASAPPISFAEMLDVAAARDRLMRLAEAESSGAPGSRGPA